MARRWNVDVVEFLRNTDALGELDLSSLERLAEATTVEIVHSGSVLMAEGDLTGDVFVVVTGKLEVLVGDAEGGQSVVAELGRGEVVGEMAVLTGASRAATVRACRDSTVIRVPTEQLVPLIRNDPRLVIHLARILGGRLDRTIHGAESRGCTSVIAIVAAGGGVDLRRFVDEFGAALRGRQSVALVAYNDLPCAIEGDESHRRLGTFLHRMQSGHDLTLLIVDGNDDAWTRLAVRHADSVLLVGSASGLTKWSRAERVLESTEPERTRARRHLVILHEGTSPLETRRLLQPRTVQRHHHVRLGEESDVARLARIMTGSSVGLVLSGGGARGFAHFGVLKALDEAGVRIDHVGGTSIGASIAGGLAAGWDWDTMLAKERYATVGQGNMVDLSLPLVALGRGKRLTNGIRRAFGDCEFADLWLDFFCVSTDLTAGRIRVHTDGPVWRAVRASVAIPGMLPPVRDEDGHVLVDGAVLDSLPVGVMRTTFAPATVIAVDIRGSAALQSSDLPDDGVVSGWRIAANRLSHRRRPEVPGIVELLSAASAVHGSDEAVDADWVITPPVETFGVLDFPSNERMIDIGYRHAVDTIDSWDRLPGE